jgi:hypothetical protein
MGPLPFGNGSYELAIQFINNPSVSMGPHFKECKMTYTGFT